MRISVVIPVYNGAAYIQRCLDSVFAQTHPATEIIVVDDGSRDGTSGILSRNQPAIRVITQPNAGRGVARNEGIRAAIGEYVAFLDADDQFWPDHLSNLVMEARVSRAEIVYDVIGPPFFISDERLPRKPYADRIHKHLACCRIWTVNAMVCREWIIRHGVQFDTDLSIGEDTVFFWKMILLGARIGYVRQIGTTIGIHEGNTTSDPAQTARSALNAYNSLERFIHERGILLSARWRRQIDMGRRHKQIMDELLSLHAANAASVRDHVRPLARMAVASQPTRLVERCRCVLALLGIAIPRLRKNHRLERIVFGFSVSRVRPVQTLKPRNSMPRVAIYAIDQDPTTTSSLGIYHYTRNLIHTLALMPDPGFRVVLLLGSSNVGELCPSILPSWMECRLTPGRYATGIGRLWADHILGPRLIRSVKADLVHFPKGYLPLGNLPCKVLATMHDTIASHYAAHHSTGLSWLKFSYFNWLTCQSLRQADRILTVSRFSRDELDALVPGSVKKIDVVYEGPGIVSRGIDSNQVRSGVLVLGSRFPHKATAETLRLLSAYALKHEWREPVVVTGLNAWLKEWGPMPVGVEIRFVGRVSDAELLNLMASSRALVLLSIMEGFGLPALESYEAGTPVCYRSTTALGEILEGVPGGWDGRDEETFFVALGEVLAMTTDGIARVQADLAARYNWKRAVKYIMKVYREMLETVK
jgi:glycosyltransferase involved in cell wall biosynthesis